MFPPNAEYIMRNAGLEGAQAGIKIAGRNINNLRYAGDTILMAESEEEQNGLHSVVFEIAHKYYIQDSFVDYEGYSISSKGFLPTVVDIMVI